MKLALKRVWEQIKTEKVAACAMVLLTMVFLLIRAGGVSQLPWTACFVPVLLLLFASGVLFLFEMAYDILCRIVGDD